MAGNGNLGAAGQWLKHHGERVTFEERNSDPSNPISGEAWLRVDLTDSSINKIAELRFHQNNSTQGVNVYQAGSSQAGESEVLRVPVDGTLGFIPVVATSDAKIPQLRFPHGGQTMAIGRAGEPPSGGVARYAFNEGSGTTATDDWKNNDATISGATYTTTAHEGSHALDFDGTDDYVQLPTITEAQFDYNEPFSLSAWVYNGTGAIISDRDGNSGYEGVGIFTSGSSETDAPVFVLDSGAGLQSVRASTSPTTATWYHVVGTHAGTNNASDMTIYVDAVDETSVQSDDDISGGVTHSADYRIGARPTGEAWFTGLIDLVDIYEKELSSTEVSNLYNTGSING